ncbi:MAG: hypothetical protein WBV43_10165 [Pseudolabrys sp.]
MRLLTGPFQMMRVEIAEGIAATFGGGCGAMSAQRNLVRSQNIPAMTLANSANSANSEANDTK